ncbi:hypothetical protein CPI83_29775 (plasmid) [Rhodococcus sp. H-CA8f]|uniref:hypothetical protein n=1 Tax=Rhodococcus sp. H-CA8f TaxID=1727214 RepID=UPI000BE3B07D|nr:hypothetical protein [Rhodococcus sp. H-CA8f]ATI36390.1 hypothetical protein CPI83_29775 [Rhodococcus sp. H-CA8f]
MDQRDIAGYTYKAENLMPEKLIEVLIAEGTASPGARGMISEELVDQLAAERGIDRLDLYSYDSGDFPKHILTEEIGPDDKNWYKP